MRRRWFLPWLLIGLLLPVLAQAATATATLDRQSVALGDTVTLNLHVQGSGGFAGMPDLAPLAQDFTVLGQSQSSNLSIINGRRSAELVIGVVLAPKRVGTLTIPALSVAGAQTAPLQLVVTPPSTASAPPPDRNVFMEATVTPHGGWVGQQLSYVVRLYYRGNLSSGTLDTPQIDGVALDQVGKDLRYDETRAGRHYHVIERDYALIPQHAGTLAIPALGFQGEALDPNDPDSFFGVGTTVTASAPALSVPVQAAPAGWGQATWLPARSLRLTLDGWPTAGTPVRVGQPVNLVMHLSAIGLAATALPNLSLPPVDGAQVYPDQPKTTAANDGPWLAGSRERAFALVPERAGTLVVPATTLRWFDVTTGQAQTAEIPAHTLTVLPAASAAAGSPPPATSAGTRHEVAAAAPSTPSPRHAFPWRWIALASIVLWLLSLLAWWRQRRRRASLPAMPATRTAPTLPPDVGAARRAFEAAVRSGTAAEQLHCLLAWAHAERPAIRQPGGLAAALDDDAQCLALAALQRRCYGTGASSGDAADPGLAFARGFAWRGAGKPPGDGLPPLYPFDLG